MYVNGKGQIVLTYDLFACLDRYAVVAYLRGQHTTPLTPVS